MSRILLASLLPLAVMVGCGDPNGSGGNGSGGNTECNHSDCDVTDFEAMIVATTPFEGVQVTVDGTDADCVGTSCTFVVTETDEYEVEAWDTYTFVPKSVDIEDPGEFQVSWVTGGCASDPNWAATGSCDEWVPGEYAFPPLEGSYTDENWGAEWDVEVNVSDVIALDMAWATATMSGEFYYYSDSDVWITGRILDEQTFSMVMFNAASGNIAEYLFHRD